MMTLFADTSPEVQRLLVDRLRLLADWRKLKMVADLNATVRELLLSGLRERYPNAGPEELRRRLADLILGADLAARAYGPLPDND